MTWSGWPAAPSPAGQTVVTSGLAVNRRWQNRSASDWEEQVSLTGVKCWGQMVENVSESIDRGARVIVAGGLEQGHATCGV